MGKCKQVTATLARLIALPRYENIRFESSVTLSVDNDEQPLDVYNEAMEMCRNNVRSEIDRFTAQKDE